MIWLQNKLLQWGAAILAILGIIASIYRAGGKNQQAKQDKANLKAMEKANEVENNNASLNDGDAFKRLSSRWRR